MPTTNACWGIEVGAHAIKALKLEATGEASARLTDWALIPHPKVLSTPGVDPNDVIRVSLGALANQVDLSKASIAVSIPGHSSFARFAKLPPVEPKKVADIIKFEAQQQIPFPLDQVEWDYQTFKVEDSPELEVGIFAVTKERINERLQMLDDVGVTPNYVNLSPIAVYNALAYDLEFGASTPGTIIVDIGTTSTDLVIATPGRMWVRTFPLGGHQFTEALVNQFQLSYPKAEKLKREAQDTKHARQVFQAMRPVFTDLAQDIQRSIGYFQSLHPEAKLDRVIGVGETWRLPGLRKYLKQQLGMDVYRIESFKKIGSGGSGIEGSEDSEDGGNVKTVDPTDRNAAFNEAAVAMATAYGLALQGLDLNAVKGNLMPVTNVRQTMWREKGKWFALAAGVAAAAGGVMFINPVKAKIAESSVQPDPIIGTTARQAKDLADKASSANATKSAEVDLRAANMASMLEHRDAYGMMTEDIKAIFEYTSERAKNWSPTAGAAPVKIPDGGVLNLIYAKSDYFGSSGTASEGEKSDPAIEIIMQVNTAAPEPRRFFADTISKWLVDNATRTGIPYVIEYDRDGGDFKVVRADGTIEQTGSDQGSRSARGGEIAPPRGQDREGRGTLGGRLGLPGAQPGRGFEQPARRSTVEYGGGGGTAGGANATDVDGLAPLNPNPTPPKTADGVFRWRMVFKPPAPQTADATTEPTKTGGAS